MIPLGDCFVENFLEKVRMDPKKISLAHERLIGRERPLYGSNEHILT